MTAVVARPTAAVAVARDPRRSGLSDDPDWYRSGVIYEMHVRAFCDSNADGIGDFPGLTSRLDYIADLGVTAIWLLPFYPSPGRDDGYDIADYMSVNPDYGTLSQFRRFLKAAHERGIRVITELVVNHTSDQHPWFQRARSAPKGSRWRSFYTWTDDSTDFADARVIFSDTETSNWTWDPVAEQYYWHRFFSHQPDLNYDNPEVQSAITRVVDFWLGMGVDGLRLDAVPYLYQREGTNCENLPETHAFLRRLRAHVDAVHPGSMLLAEANQWPEDAAQYFGQGDECHMNFHFPLMPRMFMALQMEHRTPIVDILEQTPALPPGAQWATFLRNHDELTLEMVTDEERDYMYRMFAHDPQMRINVGIRRRLAPLLGNDRRRIELLNAILYSLPGTPVLYYGDEIGLGDNVYLGDRDGVRTPMQWSPDRNAGFSTASPHRLYLPLVVEQGYHYENVNVEAQSGNPSSLLWWMSQLIALRKQHTVLGRGTLEFLDPENQRVLALVRELDGEPPFLVVANLSHHAQPVELDLSAYAGRRPREVLGHTPFPPIGELPYFLTLAPYGFYWFSLESLEPEGGAADSSAPQIDHAWPELLTDAPGKLDRAVGRYILHSRWFAGRSRGFRNARVVGAIPLRGSGAPHLLLVDVAHLDGTTDTYHVPVILTEAAQGSGNVLACLRDGMLVDAMSTAEGIAALADLTTRRRTRVGAREVVGQADQRLRRALADGVTGRPSGREQTNSTAFIGDVGAMKLVRRSEQGTNPELEVGRFLTSRVGFGHAPAVIGSVEAARNGDDLSTVVTVTALVPHDDDAWTATLRELDRFFERAIGSGVRTPPNADPLAAGEMLGMTPEDARRLGAVTAELHRALASGPDVGFGAERLGRHDRRSLAQSVRSQVTTANAALRRSRPLVSPDDDELARRVLADQSTLTSYLSRLTGDEALGSRIRVHGDLHLGQILVVGDRHVFIDFEGEPARPISQRRIKRSPLVDIAGLLRSYSYASEVAARTLVQRGGAHGWTLDELTGWGDWWARCAGDALLDGYRTAMASSTLVPTDDEAFGLLLRCCLIEKAAYELRYEIDHRPDWVAIPLRALAQLVDGLDTPKDPTHA
ncbi:MAG: maltose alpha-D-glucosyltransferase [Acidimicrobiales bacterium]